MNLSEDWAQRLLSDSNGLRSTAYLPSILTQHEGILEVISDMFLRFDKEAIPNARLWVGGGQRYTISDSLITLSKQDDFTLEKRLAQASQSPNFCVTLNGLTEWCEYFSLVTQTDMLSPLFRAIGSPPQRGADFYAFFGNYGFTPFGVHDDNDHSLLWHLGPSSKTAYIWPRRTYVDLTGSPLSTPSYDRILNHALRFELRPGDLLFIPKGDFHLFETKNFSVTLGLTLFPPDHVQDCFDGLRLLLPSTQALERYATTEFIPNTLITLRRLALESNGHIITPPRPRRMAPNFTLGTSEREWTLQTRSCWPLCHMATADRSALLVRGRALWANSNAAFLKLIEGLPAEAPVSYRDLQTYMQNVVTPAALSKLVLKLYELGGIDIAYT